jgi:flavodoxin
MTAVVVFESMFGNTQQIANAVTEGLSRHLPVEQVEVGTAPRSSATTWSSWWSVARRMRSA